MNVAAIQSLLRRAGETQRQIIQTREAIERCKVKLHEAWEKRSQKKESK